MPRPESRTAVFPADPKKLEALRYPGERKLLRRTLVALVVLYLVFSGLTLLLWVGWFTLACVTVMVLRSRYPSMALEVGPDQLPEVQELLDETARSMDVKVPRCFVSWEPGNRPVFTVPLPQPAIMLSASWIKMLEPEELKFFLAKELAHGKFGHRFVLNPINVLENVGPISWVLTTPLEIGRYCLRPWMRLAEFSADRLALATLDGRIELAASALAKVTAGEEIYQRVSGVAFMEQSRKLRGGIGLWVLEVLSGKIGFGSRLHRLIRFAESPEFDSLTKGGPLPPRLGFFGRWKRRLGGVTVEVEVDAGEDPLLQLPEA
jgi:Zn-dependent protease with chaperone function